ncbi:integrase arm-type DNA-binding domain-containing protein [Massilia sp. B-10]|nr:integrase arm-type DNA-binding domain-containing protein [Massilia sp. B-10]
MKMPRVAKELGPLDIKRLTAPGYHAVGVVPGLHLQITKTGSRSWVLRTTVGAKRREIGLGQYPAVGLALAREKAQAAHDQVKDGVDPVEVKAAARRSLIQQQHAAKALAWTFKRCTEKYIEAMAPGWRNDKHTQQWTNTMTTYAFPIIGDLPADHIRIDHVIAVIQPHWLTKNETMNRVHNRIELVLDWAAVMKYRDGDNPARWKGNLDKLLPKRSSVAPVESHAAVAESNLFDFMARLRQVEGISARCLEFVVLTVARSGEARLATWGEIDWSTCTWNIPGGRMKSGRDHRVPLSAPAITLLRALPRLEGEDLVFPGRVAHKTAFRHGPVGGDEEDESGCRSPWIPVLVLVLVRCVDVVPHGSTRNGPGPRHRK